MSSTKNRFEASLHLQQVKEEKDTRRPNESPRLSRGHKAHEFVLFL